MNSLSLRSALALWSSIECSNPMSCLLPSIQMLSFMFTNANTNTNTNTSTITTTNANATANTIQQTIIIWIQKPYLPLQSALNVQILYCLLPSIATTYLETIFFLYKMKDFACGEQLCYIQIWKMQEIGTKIQSGCAIYVLCHEPGVLCHMYCTW